MCPKCHEPLIVVEFEGVEIDYCPECRGTWFDAGELEFVTELGGVPAGPLHRALQLAGPGRGGTRRCPRCRRKMHVIALGDSPPVEVDRCRAGHGLWLDAGELVTIVREFAGNEDAVVAGFLADLLRHGLAEHTGRGEL
jgi:hypothetical protein